MPIFQFTGLSGAGKTTLALKVAELCTQQNIPIEVIDGDVYRKTICKDLGFSKEDRQENIRRLGAAAHAFSLQNKIVIIAAINPFENIRQELQKQYGALTIWIQCNIETLTQRDTKGLYKRAMLPDGHPDKVLHFTGISDLYEEPLEPAMIIHSDHEPVEISARKMYTFIIQNLNTVPS